MGIKTIIVTAEIQINEDEICRKYSNFVINFNSKFNRQKDRYIPTEKGLKDFAGRFVNQEKAMRSFGFNCKITRIELKK